MKRFITICILSCLFSSYRSAAQNTIVIKSSNDLTTVNDSIRKLLKILETDTATLEKPVNIQIQSPVQTASPVIEKRTMVKVPDGGNMIIITDENGQIRKTMYEKTPKKRKCSGFHYDIYIDLGYNGTDATNAFSGKSHSSAGDFPGLNNNKSTSFALYAMAGVTKKHFSISTGLGVEWFNFRFAHDMTLQNIDGITKGVPVNEILPNAGRVSKSKLTASYLSVPVLLKFSIPSGRHDPSEKFFVAAGVNFGVNIGHHTKIVHSDGKYKDFDELNLSARRYGFTARAGFGSIGVFGHYYMTPLFSKGKGPQVYPYVIGLSLTI